MTKNYGMTYIQRRGNRKVEREREREGREREMERGMEERVVFGCRGKEGLIDMGAINRGRAVNEKIWEGKGITGERKDMG